MTMRAAVLGGLLVAAAARRRRAPDRRTRRANSPPLRPPSRSRHPIRRSTRSRSAGPPTIRGEVVLARRPVPRRTARRRRGAPAHARCGRRPQARRARAAARGVDCETQALPCGSPARLPARADPRHPADDAIHPWSHQVDISTTKPPHDDWGSSGLGQSCQSAVVSTFRLKKKARDSAQIEHRLKNTALHEVGHTFASITAPRRCVRCRTPRAASRTPMLQTIPRALCTAALNERFRSRWSRRPAHTEPEDRRRSGDPPYSRLAGGAHLRTNRNGGPPPRPPAPRVVAPASSPRRE